MPSDLPSITRYSYKGPIIYIIGTHWAALPDSGRLRTLNIAIYTPIRPGETSSSNIADMGIIAIYKPRSRNVS